MTPELTAKLVEAYPDLFAEYEYIKCDKGWYDILCIMCYKLDAHIRSIAGSKLKLEQIKEKYGSLRVYYSYDDVAATPQETVKNVVLVDQIIKQAVADANHTCEWCGSVDGVELRSRKHWLYLRCNTCWTTGPE